MVPGQINRVIWYPGSYAGLYGARADKQGFMVPGQISRAIWCLGRGVTSLLVCPRLR